MKITAKDLIKQYEIFHSQRTYGFHSITLLGPLLPIVKRIKPGSILDYGCGRSKLADSLKYDQKVKIYRYDPAIPEYSEKIDFRVDLVLCTDVLEHVLEEEIDNTLLELKKISDNVIFKISTRPAVKHLPNGMNCHCTVKPKRWWINKLKKHFKKIVVFDIDTSTEFMCKTFPDIMDGPRKVRLIIIKTINDIKKIVFNSVVRRRSERL